MMKNLIFHHGYEVGKTYYKPQLTAIGVKEVIEGLMRVEPGLTNTHLNETCVGLRYYI